MKTHNISMAFRGGNVCEMCACVVQYGEAFKLEKSEINSLLPTTVIKNHALVVTADIIIRNTLYNTFVLDGVIN